MAGRFRIIGPEDQTQLRPGYRFHLIRLRLEKLQAHEGGTPPAWVSKIGGYHILNLALVSTFFRSSQKCRQFSIFIGVEDLMKLRLKSGVHRLQTDPRYPTTCYSLVSVGKSPTLATRSIFTNKFGEQGLSWVCGPILSEAVQRQCRH